MIASAISEIEDEANSFLCLLFTDDGDDPQLKLIAEADKLELQITGMGDGKGYKACSDGQQRRVDIALLFSFGEAARKAQGIESSSIFIDEPFSGLDDDGKAAVCTIICELAKCHSIILVMHEMDLVSSLRPERVFRVHKGGKVEREV